MSDMPVGTSGLRQLPDMTPLTLHVTFDPHAAGQSNYTAVNLGDRAAVVVAAAQCMC